MKQAMQKALIYHSELRAKAPLMASELQFVSVENAQISLQLRQVLELL